MTSRRLFILAAIGAAGTSAAACGDAPRDRQFWVNVLDHGADNTGAKDSTGAFSTAINALPAAGGWVYAPAGSYKISSTLKLTQFRGLRGDGKGMTTLKYVGAGPCISATNADAGGVTALDSPAGFEGFTIDGSSAKAGAVGLKIGNLYGSQANDIGIRNFNTAGAIGLYFNNSGAGDPDCERNRFTGITLYLNTTGAVFDTGSFDYSVYEFVIEANVDQSGVTLQNGAALYGCRVALRGNFAVGTSSNSGWVLALDPGNTSGTSSIQNGEFDVVVEPAGAPGGVSHKSLVLGGSRPDCQLTGTGVVVFATPYRGTPFQGAAVTTGSLFGFSGYVNDVTLGLMVFGDAAAFHGGTQIAVFGSNTLTMPANYTLCPQFGGVQEFALPNSAVTIAGFSGAPYKRARQLELLLHQPAAGANCVVTWPGNVKWAGGAHTLSTANGAVDKVRLTYYPSNDNWYAELMTAYA
jgi:hypothetical protein